MVSLLERAMTQAIARYSIFFFYQKSRYKYPVYTHGHFSMQNRGNDVFLINFAI
jgi:hypothetical protein